MRLLLSLLLLANTALAQHLHGATPSRLALLYGFNHDETARLFARAAELDPASPMPHWGIAYALGPNHNLPAQPDREALAWRAIHRATRLLPTAPARERAYVEALLRRYSKAHRP
jgi:hypothetical protein